MSDQDATILRIVAALCDHCPTADVASTPTGHETLVEEVAAQMATIEALEARAEAAEALAASITPDDAAVFVASNGASCAATRRVFDALRAHAAKVSR